MRAKERVLSSFGDLSKRYNLEPKLTENHNGRSRVSALFCFFSLSRITTHFSGSQKEDKTPQNAQTANVWAGGARPIESTYGVNGLK